MSTRGNSEEPFDYVRVVPGSVDRAVGRVTDELKARGFGVLATLAVHTILEQRIGARVPPWSSWKSARPATRRRPSG